MRPTLNLRFGSGKSLISSSYMHHETIDIPTKYPVFNKILNTNDVKLLDISNLQVETEKIMCLLGYRMMNLTSGIEGKPFVIVNGVSPLSLNNPSSSLPTSVLSTDNSEQPFANNNTNNVNNKTNDLIVKSSPEKPLAFIISQNRPSTRRSSGVIKRKLLSSSKDEISSNHTIKRKKTSEIISEKPVIDEHLSTPITNSTNYEIPNKFWELMEPYCAEINEEHIRTLDSLIQAYENDLIYYEVPEMPSKNEPMSENTSVTPISCGTGLNLRRNQSISGNNNLSGDNSDDGDSNHHLNGFVDNKNSVDLSNLLKKIDIEIRKPLSQTKSLEEFPQKFVENLARETDNFIKQHQTLIKESSKLNGCTKNVQSSKSIAKQLRVSNSFKLERHIKKTVEDLGMCNFNLPFVPKLNPNQDLKNEPDQQGIAKSSEADIIDPLVLNSNNDYVELNLPQPSNLRKRKLDFRAKEDKALIGLSRRQAELKLVSESNLGMLRRLMVAAKRDTKRQEIERRLAVADADVIECYNIIESYRPTHKVPLKKDRDAAYKALKERKKILKELESLDTEFM